MFSRRSLAVIVAAILVSAVIFGIAQHRNYIRDFEVYRTAAQRALAAEPLYRADDGGYQLKYWPVFAFAMAPFAKLPLDTSKVIWFALSVAVYMWLVVCVVHALPGRRLAHGVLIAWTVVLTGKFIVRELVNGQIDVMAGALVFASFLAFERRRPIAGGLLAGVAAIAKPYALIVLPWIAVTQGAAAIAAAIGVVIAGLLLPATVYGWTGNLELLRSWYVTVSSETPTTVANPENISYAGMWARWIGWGPAAGVLSLAMSVVSLAVAAGVWWRGRAVRIERPSYLDVGLLLLLVPLVSPSGWDFVMLIAAPAIVCLVDRFTLMTPAWRTVTVAGFALTSFLIYDLVGRAAYIALAGSGAGTIGAMLLVASLVNLRVRRLA